MGKVLLYSGGFDSELYRFLLQPDVLLYIDYGGKYTDLELGQIKKNTYSKYEKLIIDQSFDFGSSELSNHIIPMRNVYFAMKALEYGELAILGVTYYDIHRDKANDVLCGIQSFVTNYYSQGEYKPETWDNPYCTVSAPYSKLTKGDLLRECLEEGADPTFFQNIRTCYSPTSKKGCGKCQSCLQKALALADNGLFKKELFDTNPIFGCSDIIDEFLINSEGEIVQEVFIDNLRILEDAS